jgi:tetratricopeptide (TPR) repeat protein
MQTASINYDLEIPVQSGIASGSLDGQINTIAKTASQSASDWNELGNTYTRKRMYDEAINAYKTAITMDPKNGYPYSNLGILYQQLGSHKVAVQLFKKSIELLDSPDDRASSWYRLGNAYRRINEHALAREAYRKATEIAPVANNLLARTRISLLDNVARS